MFSSFLYEFWLKIWNIVFLELYCGFIIVLINREFKIFFLIKFIKNKFLFMIFLIFNFSNFMWFFYC